MMRIVLNVLLALAVIALVALGDAIAPPHAVSVEAPRIGYTGSDLPVSDPPGAARAA